MHPSEIKMYLRGRRIREERKKRQQQSPQRSGVSEDQIRREEEALSGFQ